MAGFDPLAVLAPDLYTKQLAIQRRQALGQALLEANNQSPTTAYSGLAAAGKNILGAYLLKNADTDMAGLYAPQTPDASAPITPSANTPPAQPSGQVSNSPISAPSQQVMAPTGQVNPSQPIPQVPTQRPQSIPDALNGAIPDIPGLSHQQSMLRYLQDPSGYWKALDPTSEYRNALVAANGDPNGAAQILRGQAIKGASESLRPGGGSINYATGQFIGVPNVNGMVPTMQPNGQMGVQLAPGAGSALAQSGYAEGVGRAMLTPQTGFDANGQPVATNSLQMSGNGAAANLIAPGLGSTGAGLSPQLPAQQAPFLSGQGKAATDRYNGTITEAEGSPDRQNVLSNIIQLSASGVPTGPTSEWLAHLQGVYGTYFPNSKAADNAARYQELTKFAYQNAIRAWQVAGGTGTDNQMEAQMHANVNNQMNPRALQAIAKWALAGEHAVMGKANAQNAWLARNGNTPQQQTAFENAWRNAMDRKVYILQGLSPQEQQAFIHSLSPQEARDLLQKRAQLRALGGLQ